MKYISLSKSSNLVSVLLLSTIILKFYVVVVSFGSTDLTGLSQRYLFQYNSFNWFKSGEHLLPYFPFVEIIFFYSGKVAEFFSINYIFVLKYISVIFEISLAFLIIKFFEKKKKKNINLNLLLILILLNPLSLYVNSLLGFFETLWIFFLMIAVYLHEFKSNHSKYLLIPFFLALSVSIKPVALFFVFFFYYKNNYKKLFILTFFSTFILLHIPYLIASFGNEEIFFAKIEGIISKFFIGHQQGEFGLSEIERIISKIFSYNFFYFFKLLKIIEILLLFSIYYSCLISNKIKSYEFIYLILLVVLLLNDNLHENYLYWIVPFAILLNYKKTLYYSIFALFLIIELDLRKNSQLLLFNFPNYFSFLSELDFENLRLRETNLYQYIINTLIFYLSLLFLFEKRIVKKINLNKFSFVKLLKILRNSFQLNEKLFPINKFKFTKLYFFPLCLFIFYIVQNSVLVDVFKIQNDIEKDSIIIPKNLKIFNTHGNNLKFTTNFQTIKNKDYEIIYISGYFSSLEINNKKVDSSFNILHYIYDKFTWQDNNQFPFKKVKLSEFLKDGYNEITIYSNIPHSLESFGLIFILIEDQKVIKNTVNFDWKVYLNKEKINYNFEKLKINNYIKQNSKLLENYEKFFLDTKILKFNIKENLLVLDPRILFILIFVLISIICLIFQSVISKFKFKV